MYEEIRDLDFFTGIRCGISPCCIDFYELSWLPSIKKEIPEYSKTMYELSDETGILFCPDCIAKKMNNISVAKHTLDNLKDFPIFRASDQMSRHFTGQKNLTEPWI